MRMGKESYGFVGEVCLSWIWEKIDAFIEGQGAMIIGKFSMDDDERLIGGESGICLFGLFLLDDLGG